MDKLYRLIACILVCAGIMAGAHAAEPAATTASAPAAATDPLLGTWAGTVEDGGQTRPFGLRLVAGKNPVPDALWTLPEAHILDYGPYAMTLQDGWYNAVVRTNYDIKYHVSGDQKHIYGILYFDTHTLPFQVEKGELPKFAPVDSGGEQAKPLWTFKTGGAVWSTPAFADGTVYFGSNDHKIYALDAATGKQKWSVTTGGAVWAPARVDGAYVYILSDDGYLYKLVRANGKRVWRFDTHGGKVKRAGYDRLASSPVIQGGTLYFGSAEGSLYALNPKDGHERWHYFTQGAVRSTPAVADGRVFFGSYDDAMYALDAKKGTLLWRRDTHMPVVSTPLVVKDLVYIGSRNADFYALNAADGKLKWRAFDWVSWVESSATERDGIVYIGCSDCMDLFAYDAVTGKEQWRFNTGGESWPIPAVDEKRVYIGSVGYDGYGRLGGFYAVDRSTGKPVWRFDMPAMGGDDGYGVGGSPVLGAGRVYFGSLDGSFYAFATGD
jgi:eukaryotic-like serine/threonine-protein kinase